ncbi:dihydrodipicolinate reductase C-terminal domain-containing protein [Magnetospira sp. QH-2]|uniref:dihydrodipicolinate reductase C-terminal domain-containing protein n=1 Tax=Magnetospira sp. (strain QH-2) TaxID=1288970 RepID=UPI0003E81960|nr:dihydrodipicolinate reductase C-terminal domain-containing protein [Magnetospira sp. QH-2]CCQ72136.1 Dihydrodipicolinate reductase [Magnetospira sp. QH-2]
MAGQDTILAVVGASGKVGRELVALMRKPGSKWQVIPIVSAQSAKDGKGDDLAGAQLEKCDAVIDFSTPAATMALLDRLGGMATPLVVGTTGFTAEQADRLTAEGAVRPILVGTNFTHGFEDFLKAASDLVAGLPDAAVTVGEIYNARKKKLASGTTQRMTTLFESIKELDGSERHITQDIQRIGDTPGVNRVTLAYGAATIDLTLTVHSRAAYAMGAVRAAQWLIGRPNGYYAPVHMLP